MSNLYTIELLAGYWRVREVGTNKLYTQTFRVYAHAQRLVDDLNQSALAIKQIEADEQERRAAIRARAIARLSERSLTWAKAVAEIQREAA
jgi:hypothetical protein